ncbi:MAG: hypothetical protein QM704_13790 [Anaeromyxobacteraceae bacterium]
MATSETGWTLISVLFSSIPLTSSLAGMLHATALELYRTDAAMSPVGGDLVSGRVVNLKRSMALGGIAGPAFEAKLETERGSGTVRYLLTNDGLQLMGLEGPRAAPPPARRAPAGKPPLLN